MVEAQTQRRAVTTVNNSSVTAIDSPPATYQPNKRSTNGTENELIVIQELDEEERIRDRVRHFASNSSLHDPKEPQSPTFFLEAG